MRIRRSLTGLAVLGLVAAAGGGCGDGETPRRPDTRIDPARGSDRSAPAVAYFPRFTCVDSIARRARAVEVSAIVPPDMVQQPRPHYQGWTPGSIADLAVTGSRAVVLDGQTGQVTVFEQGFQNRLTFGGRGGGPGEFRQPVAVAVAEARTEGRAEVLVLDQHPPRIGVFDLEGRHLRTFQVPSTGFPMDLAVDGGGRILVSNRVVNFSLSREGARDTLVRIHAPGGEPVAHIGEITADDLEPPRFVLPGFSEVRVRAANGRIAIFYPAAGHVEVYRNGVLETAVAVCIPEAVREGYAQQRAQGMLARSASASPMEMVSDVHLGTDGSIHTISAFATEDGWYHIDHFGADGRPLGSTVFSTQDIRLPSQVRFGGSPYDLFGFDQRGAVGQFRVHLDFVP